jgi:pyridoxamine 5'-phosphate oxidase
MEKDRLATSEAVSEYADAALLEADLSPNPFVQLQNWVERAVQTQVPQPYAMTLATATTSGRPSARIVLLRGADERGLTFFTNYESRKSDELTHNPYAAVVFYWPELERQLRVEGRIERVSAEESDAYFWTRPRGSRLGAWASPQSQVISDRKILDIRMKEFVTQYPGEEVPRPPHWGGFRIVPTMFEFWQGRPNRLHDRLRYRKDERGTWIIERLGP